MRCEVAKLLFDIKSSCDLVKGFIKGKMLDDYGHDAMLRSAVERQLMIAGEALGQALRLDPGLERSISNTRKIVGFRNILAHGYSIVEPQTVWGIIEIDLPVLRDEVSVLLGEK